MIPPDKQWTTAIVAGGLAVMLLGLVLPLPTMAATELAFLGMVLVIRRQLT